MDEKDKKREELLKSAKFAEKFLGGLTEEHMKGKYQEAVKDDEAKEKDDLFIWEPFFKKEKAKKQKIEDDDLFPWDFLFDKDKKKKKKK